MCICHSSWDLCVIIFNVKKKKQKKKIQSEPAAGRDLE